MISNKRIRGTISAVIQVKDDSVDQQAWQKPKPAACAAYKKEDVKYAVSRTSAANRSRYASKRWRPLVNTRRP